MGAARTRAERVSQLLRSRGSPAGSAGTRWGLFATLETCDFQQGLLVDGVSWAGWGDGLQWNMGAGESVTMGASSVAEQ